MTTLTHPWRDLRPVRAALSQIDPADPEVWADRLRVDERRAARHQSPELASYTAIVEARSRQLGAEAVVLSGSTARGRRTRVSDLDYHVIGAKPSTADLPADIDVYSDSSDQFDAKLRSGDDFAHWSVWYGCVLFDSGVVQAGAAYVARSGAWPDPERKRRQARDALEFAERIVASGDHDAALERVREALSLTARWWLLSHDVFPLARDELRDQLVALGQSELGQTISDSIHERPDLAALADAVADAQALTAAGTLDKRVRARRR